jgi:hypothetical protein
VTLEERRAKQIEELTDAIYADCFDGMRGGTVTMSIDALVDEIVEAVFENWIDRRLAESEPPVASAIQYGLDEVGWGESLTTDLRVNYPEEHEKR